MGEEGAEQMEGGGGGGSAEEGEEEPGAQGVGRMSGSSEDGARLAALIEGAALRVWGERRGIRQGRGDEPQPRARA